MNAFKHVCAMSVQDAVRLLGSDSLSRPISGGTDLLTQMKLGILRPERLVDLKTIRDADKIDFDEKAGLRIGALATLSDIAASDIVRERYPCLARAINVAASPQLRNQGTIGGNLVQGSRCWYYRGPFDCWLKGGELCYARNGENEHHAIFGDGPCYTVHPSDPATALAALRAEIGIVGLRRKRRVPIQQFFRQPANVSRQLTVLTPDEIVVDVLVPVPPEDSRSTYLKAMERRVWSFALASVAADLAFDGDVIREAVLVLGGVAPTPWPVPDAAAALIGYRLTDSFIERAADVAVAGARPLARNGYKVALVKGLVIRVLNDLIAGGDRDR